MLDGPGGETVSHSRLTDGRPDPRPVDATLQNDLGAQVQAQFAGRKSRRQLPPGTVAINHRHRSAHQGPSDVTLRTPSG
jgi:hypothetical protein